MRPKVVLPVAAAVAAVIVGAALIFDWSLEKAVLLSPVLVVIVGATAGLLVLWARMARDSLRR